MTRLAQRLSSERFLTSRAKSVRYASRFHRQQEITTYIKHSDSMETYANLGKFLCNNYKQALGILETEPALWDWMKSQGVASFEEFHTGLKEEKEWLLAKKASGAAAMTTEMEYVQKMANLSVSNAHKKAKKDDTNYDPDKAAADKRAILHAEELWIAAMKHLKEKKFVDALNALELPNVQQIFEPTKINRSGTDEKTDCSPLEGSFRGAKNAISRYNIAAQALDNPAPTVVAVKF
ncbi:hypothetical protein B0H11DRAFT_2398988 [Mycena galericulata]|nr:hypothetical protein B0H11DRAFT_2398988 [Mycena galericulata]